MLRIGRFMCATNQYSDLTYMEHAGSCKPIYVIFYDWSDHLNLTPYSASLKLLNLWNYGKYKLKIKIKHTK